MHLPILKARREQPCPNYFATFIQNEKLLRAVDEEGTVLDVVVPQRRNTKAATRLLRKLLKNQSIKPSRIVTDRFGSYGAEPKFIGLRHLQDVGGRKNNRAECSYVQIRRRERKSQKFRSIRNAQNLLFAHGQIYNFFNHRRHFITRNTLRKFRSEANAEWDSVTALFCV